MSDFPWDPTSGNANYTSSPYQYWAGSEPEEAGGKVEFVINNMLYTTNIEADGSWSFQLPVMLMDGQHNLSVRFIDRALNYGPPHLSTIHVDTTPPAKPIIQAVLDDVGDAMPLSNGQVTDDTKPRFSGSAEPQSIVRLFDKNTGALLGSAVANGNGYWTIEEEMGYGQREVFVTSSDRHNQVSEPSESWVINIKDPNAPPASDPYITGGADNVGAAQGELAFGAVTDDNRPTLKGMAEPGSMVYLFVKNAADQWLILGSTRAESNGSWSIETAQLNAGQYDFQVGSSDVRNPAADIFRLTIADAGSSALKPVIVDAFDDVGAATGALANGAVTDDRNPTLRGTAEANSVVHIFVKGEPNGQWMRLKSVVADAAGNWESSTYNWSGGTYSFQVNNSATRNPDAEIFRLTLAPGGSDALKPVIVDAFDDSGATIGALTNGATTDDFTPTLRGTAEANSIVYIHARHVDGAWVVLGSTRAGTDGKWEHESRELKGGSGLYEFQAGNSATRNPNDEAFTLNIKSSNVMKPVIVDAYDDSGAATGALANGATTDDRTPTLRGTAEANSIVYIHFSRSGVNWEPTASVQTNAKGEWSFTPTLYQDHMWDFYVSSTGNLADRDVAGAFKLDVKSGNALKPVIVDAYDDSGAATGALTNGAVTDDRTPTLRGTAEANSIVYIRYGRSTIGFEPVASVKANAKGEWSFTPELYQDHVWDFYVSSSTTFDYTNRFHIELDTTAGSPMIEGAWDNSGEGKLVAHNGYTKDTTPELRGTAEPNSTVTLQYVDRSRPWSQGTTVTVQAGPDGKWSHQLPALDNTYYHFRTKITDAAGNDSSYSADFLLYIDSIAPESPVITGVWDNEGSLRELGNGDFTNDRTPEIRGTGEPNSKIIVVLAKGQEGWSNNNRTVETWADNNGNWKVTVPAPALTDDRWFFRAKAVDKAGNESTLGAQTAIEVRENLIDSRTVWDFNDGTLQGWTAAGKYAQSGQLLVKKWSAPGNSNEAGSYTNAVDGFAGNVVYRDITVIKGQVYQFSFDVVRLNGEHYAPKLGMTVDGQTVIAQADVGQSWQNRSGTYIANETKTVRVAVTNGQNSGGGNDFAFDNIVINPVGNINNGITDKFNNITAGEYSSLTTDLFSVTNYAKKIKVGSIYNLGDGSTIIKPEGQGADFRFTLKNGAKANSLEFDLFNYQPAAHSKKQYIVLKLYLGSQLVETKTLILADVHGLHKVTTSGKEFDGFTLVQPSSSDNWSIDNVKVQSTPVSSSRGFLQEDSVLFELDDQQSVLLLSDALEGTVQKGVDLNGHGSTTLTVTAGDVLAFGEKDLFIADGRTQLMINGDASDVVNLDELLGDSQDWSQLTGTMTVGGVEYNVWQHSGEDAELLIQSGVQTQLN
jgi:hypothetical protein